MDGEKRKKLEKELKELRRRTERAEQQLHNYEQLVDRTQHLLNTRIREVEEGKEVLAIRTKELEKSERRFRQLADAAFETIIIHSNGVIIDCNDAAVSLYGFRKEHLIDKPVMDLVSDSKNRSREWISHATETPEEDLHLNNTSEFPVEVRSRAIELKGEAALVTVVRDITSHKQMQEHLKSMAYTDSLTCVSNRRHFLEQGRKEISRAIRNNQPLSLLMLDIDRFKSINDNHGHDTGDLALQSLSHTCCRAMREEDLFARMGGEEFAALLPNTSIDEALVFADRLRESISEIEIETQRGVITFTASMGVTDLIADNPEETIDSMLNRADKGLYRAKEGGRNQVAKTY